MHILHPLTFLSLTLFSFPALTLTIPPSTGLQILNPSTTTLPTNSTLLNSTSNPNANPPFTCTRRTSQTRNEPGFADCAGVLRSLPLNPNVGTFYNSGPGDFQLPYFETYRTCQVVVELLNAHDKVRSSWLAVQVAALELNEACQDVRTAPGLGNAVTYVGALKRMKVTLKEPGR